MTEPLLPIFHPDWGAVNPMRETEQAAHVWQHLYNPAERWDALVGTDIQPLRSAAEQKGCPPQPPKQPRSQTRPRLPKVPKPCYVLLKEHHNAYYGPTYLHELGQSRTEWGVQSIEPHHLMCCTPRGVLVAVGNGRPRVVLTAFRPDLPFDDGSNADDATYHQVAHERWEGSTMRDHSTWKQGVLRTLEQAVDQPPQRTADAWRLVRAIGHARAIAEREPDVAARLGAAEALLERHRQDIAHLLVGKLRTEALLAGLKSALAAEEPHETQDRLLALADILVVSEVLGDSSEIERIHDRARQLIASWPSGLTGFEHLARARLETSSPAVQPLWKAVTAAQPLTQPPLAQATPLAEPPSASLGMRVRHLLEAFSLAQALPPAASASSGIDLGPAPVEIYRQGARALVLTLGDDLHSVVLQVSGLSSSEVPQGTRDGIPLSFARDEFGAWLAEARPGVHLITLRDEAVEFTLSSP
jgi:hypothetical protein